MELRKRFPRFSPDDETLDALHQELSDYVGQGAGAVLVDAEWGALRRCNNGTLYVQLKPNLSKPLLDRKEM